MLDKLDEVERRFEELTSLLGDAQVIAERDTYRKYTKEHAELEPLVACFRQYRRVQSELAQARELVETGDSEMRALAQAEFEDLRDQNAQLERDLVLLLLPKDPNDEKNIILEIRAGTGGDEAALFAEDLFGMYTRYSEEKRWRIEILSTSYGTVGGLKDITARVEGYGAYSRFKYERGVHRVQRVPKTETQGRIHTSTVTVAILPEAEEVDVEIFDKDLRIDVFRSSGPGGQSVNTTDSAVRITHLPTGLVVSCQDEKSQHKNKAKAMTVLRSRMLDMFQAEADSERSADRKSQIGSGDRAEKIRTYNYPQSRITDHRIGLTLHQLDSILGGKLDLLIDPLITHYQTEALQQQST